MHLLDVRIADAEADLKRATDFVVTVIGGDVAVRIRRTRCAFRDWTVRARRDTGADTELAKLQAGYARWYLYCWQSTTGSIGEWILVDLDEVRRQGILAEPRRLIDNYDGTYFVAIPATELCERGLLVAHAVSVIAA